MKTFKDYLLINENNTKKNIFHDIKKEIEKQLNLNFNKFMIDGSIADCIYYGKCNNYTIRIISEDNTIKYNFFATIRNKELKENFWREFVCLLHNRQNPNDYIFPKIEFNIQKTIPQPILGIMPPFEGDVYYGMEEMPLNYYLNYMNELLNYCIALNTNCSKPQNKQFNLPINPNLPDDLDRGYPLNV